MTNDQENFDELFAELMGDHTPKPEAVACVEEPIQFVPSEITPEAVTGVPEAPKPVEKARAKYEAIPADQKTVVDGAPCITTVYPAGYAQFLWPNSKFRNACSLYLDQVEGLEKFFQSEAYKSWKAAAVAAGLRTRSK
jgi:hypothetical protein